MLQYWTIYYPQSAATGLLVARALIDPTQRVILHAAPPVLTVEVSSQNGARQAFAKDLSRTAETPMCALEIQGDQVVRKDIWPTEDDLGTVIILPGGEAGILNHWWNADDYKEWRWQTEFYNSIR